MTSACRRDSPNTWGLAILDIADRSGCRSMPGVTKAIDDRRCERVVPGIGVVKEEAGVSKLIFFTVAGAGVEPATPRTANLRLI